MTSNRAFRESFDPADRTYLTEDLTANEELSLQKNSRMRQAHRRDSRDDFLGEKVDLIAIDGSEGSDRALLHAARNLPKDHSLLLVHGVPTMWRSGSKALRGEEFEDLRDLEEHYAGLCTQANRNCIFKHFAYTSMTNFGTQVCEIADKKGASSVVIGRREEVSGLRRNLLGSASQSVINRCHVPVTVVGAATHEDIESDPPAATYLG